MSRKIRKIAIFIIMSMFMILIAGCGSKNSISADSFYYEQLTELEKTIYRNVEANKDSFIEGKKFECFRGNNFNVVYLIIHESIYSRAINAYIMDNPLASIWCNLSAYDFMIEDEVVTEKGEEKTETVFYLIPKEETGTMHHFEDSEEIRAAIKEVEKTAKEFINTLEGCTREKIHAIHDWMIKDFVYLENIYDHDIYGSLIKKEATCYGISCGFKYLCDLAGINAISVIGKDHVWNYVQDDDNRWYLMDVTWDLDTGYSYFLTEIVPEMVSGEREYHQSYRFSYQFFYQQ